MMILGVGDVVWLALIAASGPASAILGAIVTTIINGYYAKKNTEAINHQTEVVKEIGGEAKEATKEVKQVLAHNTEDTNHKLDCNTEKLEVLGKVTLATHTFVNSVEGHRLYRMAIKSRRLAELEPTEGNILEARLDEEAYQTHREAQAAVDVQPGTDAEKAGK